MDLFCGLFCELLFGPHGEPSVPGCPPRSPRCPRPPCRRRDGRASTPQRPSLRPCRKRGDRLPYLEGGPVSPAAEKKAAGCALSGRGGGSTCRNGGGGLCLVWEGAFVTAMPCGRWRLLLLPLLLLLLFYLRTCNFAARTLRPVTRRRGRIACCTLPPLLLLECPFESSE